MCFVGGYFVGNNVNKNSESVNTEKNTTYNSQSEKEVQNKREEKEIVENKVEVDDKEVKEEKASKNEVKEEKNTEKDLGVNGKYKFEETTKNYYHCSNIKITNQTSSSIEFSINASHGNDVDHVNIGEVSGTAKKVNIPEDSIIPESTQVAYQFTDNIDGEEYKITFVFTAHRTFQYVNVIEDYPNDRNPYAGNRVYFAGEYEKIG